MGIDPKSAYGVEDSFNGVRSLHAAGLYPIMVPDLLEPDEEMHRLAGVILPDLLAVREYLKAAPSPKKSQENSCQEDKQI